MVPRPCNHRRRQRCGASFCYRNAEIQNEQRHGDRKNTVAQRRSTLWPAMRL
jgi:hypothetical protein